MMNVRAYFKILCDVLMKYSRSFRNKIIVAVNLCLNGTKLRFSESGLYIILLTEVGLSCVYVWVFQE